MGYRQHNNPFSKSISPLKHNVTDRSGNPWEHVHDGRNVTGKRQFREIKGQSTFGQKADKKVRGRTEREIAMEYANQLADYYNQGAITGGNFRADDFDRIKADCDINENLVKLYKKFSPGPITYILKLRKNSRVKRSKTKLLRL